MRFSPGLAGTDRPFDPFMLALPLVLLAGSRFGRGCRFDHATASAAAG
jgi:hypothetical protein